MVTGNTGRVRFLTPRHPPANLESITMSACEKFREYLSDCTSASSITMAHSAKRFAHEFDQLHQRNQENTGQCCTSLDKRKSYDKVSLEDFKWELEGNLRGFIENMKHLGVDSMSFPEWYETLAAWSEVGTDSENMMYGKL